MVEADMARHPLRLREEPELGVGMDYGAGTLGVVEEVSPLSLSQGSY